MAAKKDTLLPAKKRKVPENVGKHPETVKSSVGRPTLYRDAYPEQARKLCLLGATDAELADFFEVSESTLNEWKLAHPEFPESIKQGKRQADASVADRLFQRAMGFEHAEVDIRVIDHQIIKTPITKIYAPDTTAAIFWLKNRQPKQWRDKQELEHTGNLFDSLLTTVNGTSLKPVADE